MLIVSLGGNAVIRRADKGTIEEQSANALVAMRCVALVARPGAPLIVTHGNGPVVGNILLRGECASREIPPMPLYMADADSEGGTGFLLQQTLYNELRRLQLEIETAAIVTQVVVDPADPAFGDPTKPIGPFYGEARARELARERGWRMKEVPGGWRRVVASPWPLRVVEAGVIRRMALGGVIVIAAGGGGVPVVEAQDGTLAGVDAVIDKDFTTARLAIEVGAERIITLTDVEAVYTSYGTPAQRPIMEMDVSEASALLSAGEFGEGTMGPKVRAAVEFIEGGGREVVITSPERALAAMAGRAGTRIVGARGQSFTM